MFCPSQRPRFCRPARSGDSDIPLLGILVVFLLLICVVGGGFMMFAWRSTRTEQVRAMEAEMMARMHAEEARAEALHARDAVAMRDKEADAAGGAERQLAVLILERGLTLCEKGQIKEGLLWLARGLEVTHHKDWQQLFAANLVAWGQQSAEPRLLVRQKSPVSALAVSPERKTLLCGSDKGEVAFYAFDTGKPEGETVRLESRVQALAFHPDGATVGAGVASGHCHRIDCTLRKTIGEPEGMPGPVLGLRLRADGTAQAVGSCNRGIWLGEGAGTREVDDVARAGPLLTAALAADGKRFLSGHEDGQIRSWKLPDGEPLGLLLHQGSPPKALDLSPNGSGFATASDKVVRLWDNATRRPIGPALRHDAEVLSLTFVTDGKSLLTGSADGSVRLWALPRTEGLALERLVLWAQVHTESELDAEGAVKPLTPAARDERRQRLDKLGGPVRP